MFENYGWTCPKCGKALAPWVMICPCSDEQSWSLTTGGTWDFRDDDDQQWESCPHCGNFHRKGAMCSCCYSDNIYFLRA